MSDPRQPAAEYPIAPMTPRMEEALQQPFDDPRVAAPLAAPVPVGMTQSRFLDRFRYFTGASQQVSGASMLYDAIQQGWSPAQILDEGAPWALKYSETPPAPPPPLFSNPLVVPYQSQLDNSSGQGPRECFSSSCAMAAMYWGKIENDDAYNVVRARFGDTTDSNAQVQALRSLGLKADFIQNGTVQWLENQINIGRPTPVGWLHHGHVSSPSGGGHWTICIGYNATHWIQHDPFGVADMVNGSYTANTNGKNVKYTRANWDRRWLVYSASDGWAMDIRP